MRLVIRSEDRCGKRTMEIQHYGKDLTNEIKPTIEDIKQWPSILENIFVLIYVVNVALQCFIFVRRKLDAQTSDNANPFISVVEAIWSKARP